MKHCHRCSEFKVFTPAELLERTGSRVLDERSRPPDHSMLYLRFQTAEMFINSGDIISPCKLPIRNIKNNFLSSEISDEALKNVIVQLDKGREVQDNVDCCYELFCGVLYGEMRQYELKLHEKRAHKNLYRINQPFWNNELYNIWLNLRVAEKRYLKCKEPVLRKNLHDIFKTCQYDFDKKLRMYKRRYRRGKAFELKIL